MFETDLIYRIQSLASPPLTWLMVAVTDLGYTPVYVAVMLVLLFAIRLRPALGVLLCLLFAAVMTQGLKTSIAFPRPSDVDARLLDPGAESLDQPAALSGSGFWSLPSGDARAAVRETPEPSYGFPSGHVSAATAFCLGVVLFFGWRRFLPFALAWPLVMGVSRMYLGRHFLADVVGGLVVGVLAAGCGTVLLRWLDHPGRRSQRPLRLAAVSGAALGLAVLSLFTVSLDPKIVGGLAALIWAYAVLTVVGFPSDAGGPWHRAGRLAGAVAIYLVISRLLDWGLKVSGWEDLRLATLCVSVLVLSGTILGAVTLGRRMRWFRAA
jgi:membrane-associated phospholipid phosphatase